MQIAPVCLLIMILLTGKALSCCRKASRPSKPSSPGSSSTPATPIQTCQHFSSNITQNCPEVNLDYNLTNQHSLDEYLYNVSNYPVNRLCKTSFVVPDLNCTCIRRLQEIAWRILLPECIQVDDRTTKSRFPCRSYCNQLYNE